MAAEIIDKKYAQNNKEKIMRAIRLGKIFIYPTDTIYGLGANAKKNNSVLKIREIKERETKPFSVIAPNKKWIRDNFYINKEISIFISKLPGPVTLFLNRKKIKCVSREVNPVDESLGVRIPKHWFTNIIQKAGLPFITTSVNKGGQSYMRRIEDIDSSILNSVDYVIYEGEKLNKESQKIDLRKNTKSS